MQYAVSTAQLMMTLNRNDDSEQHNRDRMPQQQLLQQQQASTCHNMQPRAPCTPGHKARFGSRAEALCLDERAHKLTIKGHGNQTVPNRTKPSLKGRFALSQLVVDVYAEANTVRK